MCVQSYHSNITTLQVLEESLCGAGEWGVQIWEELHCVELQLRDVGNQKTIRVKDRCSES